MNDLCCPCCGAVAATGPVYPVRCACGGLWRGAPGAYPEALGETGTPLWPDPVDAGLLWKREDLNATGSFKDRGAAVLVEVARRSGARSLVADSSGSAALAAAAAGARAGLPLTVHVPATIPPAKRSALLALGATVVAEGERADAARRAQAEAATAFYSSHVHHPAFTAGTGQAGREVLDALEEPPDTWLVPVGNGSLILGLAGAVRGTGVRLVAVQAAACPGLRAPGAVSRTRAAGIGIPDPPRREEILAAVTGTGGDVMEVTEEEIEAAWNRLARRGVIAEWASATVEAVARGLRGRGDDRPLLGWLTGSGLRD